MGTVAPGGEAVATMGRGEDALTARHAAGRALAVDRVRKTYTDGGTSVPALDEVSFECTGGEFVSVLGPSGCGKTTLLRCVAGLLPVTSGTIHAGGELVTGTGTDRAIVFQDYRLMPWMTILDNVSFGLRCRGVGKAERHAEARQLLDLVGLRQFADSYPGQLSGGMQQRAGLARALAVSPSLLLLDEPLGSLDAWTREVLQDELQRILAAGDRTVLMVTHSVDEAVYLSDRVLVMSPRPGRVAAVERVDFARPRNGSLRGSPEFSAARERLASILRGFGRAEAEDT